MVIVAMGATAAQALTGDGRDVLARQGTIERGLLGVPVLITSHPYYLLRLPDAMVKDAAMALFQRDLKRAVSAVDQT